MNEKTFEDIICKYPELIEDKLSFKAMNPFYKNSPFWGQSFEMKVSEIVSAVQRMKPLLDFFLKPRIP